MLCGESPQSASVDPGATCASLVRRVQDRDEAAWREFVGFYTGLLANWARAAGCPPAAVPDVCQETFVCLLGNLDRFELRSRAGSLRAYLRTIVTARVRDAYRRSRRLVAEADLTPPGAPDGAVLDGLAADSPAEIPASGEDRLWLEALLTQAMRGAFAKVETVTYKAFCLYVLEGLPAEEACRRLGLERIGTLYQQKSRFLRLVRDEMLRLLAALDDPALRAAAPGLTTAAVIGWLEEAARALPAARLTAAAEAGQIADRMAVVREALAAFPQPAPGCWLLGNRCEPPLCRRLDGRQEWTLGAGDGDIRLPAPGVSGVHCRLWREGDDWLLADTASRNGTSVNGHRVETVPLHSGDVVQIGEAMLVFVQAIETAAAGGPENAGAGVRSASPARCTQ